VDNCRVQAGGKGELCMALFGWRLTKVGCGHDSDPINKQPAAHPRPCLFSCHGQVLCDSHNLLKHIQGHQIFISQYQFAAGQRHTCPRRVALISVRSRSDLICPDQRPSFAP
jgi:hypothetical protein